MIRANNQPGPRRRKAHSKSRRGCRNCKLRKVKCDEAWPHCKACARYGVVCNYQSTAPDLQMPYENRDVTLALGSKGAVLSTGSIDNQVIRLLVRFQARTVESILKVRPETILALAHSRPYLMHSILSLSATHERYQRSLPIAENPSVFETYHFTQSLALFNQQLSAQQLVGTQDWDALWLTATFLGILTFALIDYSSTTRQREIWPLAPSNQEDLEWLNMAQGKKTIWNLIQPLGPKSLLWSMNEEYTKMHAESHPHQLLQQQRTNDIQVASLTLLKLCNITPTSSPDNNPYFTALQALLRLNQRGEDARDAAMAVVVGCSRASLLAFTSQMKDSFRDLLWLKDPIALLLLALWYEKVGREIWWTRARAMVEARSIQRYLQRYHKDHVVVGLLPDLLAC